MFDTNLTKLSFNENQSRLAEILIEANRTRKVFSKSQTGLASLTEREAHEVSYWVWNELGYRIGGWKVGATASDNIKTLGAHRPMLGRLRHDNIFRSPYEVEFDELMEPITECEFAFDLKEDLPAMKTDWSAEDISTQIRCLYPAIEIAERRVARIPNYPYTQLIADNAAAGKLVLGVPVDWDDRDLNAVEVTLRVDGGIVAAGNGSAVMGNPLASLAWAVNEAAKFGRPVKAREIITTGSCTGMEKVGRNTRQSARFGDLGDVEIHFR